MCLGQSCFWVRKGSEGAIARQRLGHNSTKPAQTFHALPSANPPAPSPAPTPYRPPTRPQRATTAPERSDCMPHLPHRGQAPRTHRDRENTHPPGSRIRATLTIPARRCAGRLFFSCRSMEMLLAATSTLGSGAPARESSAAMMATLPDTNSTASGWSSLFRSRRAVARSPSTRSGVADLYVRNQPIRLPRGSPGREGERERPEALSLQSGRRTRAGAGPDSAAPTRSGSSDRRFRGEELSCFLLVTDIG